MLKLIVKFFTLLSPLLQKLGVCATAGFIAGAFAGFILCVYYYFLNPTPGPFTNAQIVQLALLLALGAWVLIVFAFVVLVRVPFLSIWYSSLFNCILTCLLTVWVVYKLDLWNIAWFIGMLIGIWVGLMLCYLNQLLKNKTYGMHKQDPSMRG